MPRICVMEDKTTNVKMFVLLPKQTFLYTKNLQNLQESASNNIAALVDRLDIVAKEKAQNTSIISVIASFSLIQQRN